jgi:putative ABC transport system permease protein
MKLWEFFKIAITNLGHRKFRAYLTMIGIFIGITAVVAIISLGQGLQVAIQEQFEEMGTDKIYIQPGTSALGGSTAVIMDESDLRVIERTSGVIDVTGMAYKNARIQVKDEEVFGLVIGIDYEKSDLWNQLQAQNIEQGRLIQKGETTKAFAGFDFMQDKRIVDRALQLGSKVTVNGQSFDIVGFQEDFGNSGDNQQLQITAEAYERIFGERVEDEYAMIVAKIDTADDPNAIADRVEKALRSHRDVDEGDEDFTLQTAEEFLDSFNDVLGIVNVVIVGIAAISLVIGGIGIMNTMYTAVVERTQEIGIMKAIGARNGDILSIFLIESGLLGFVGGLVGVVIGLAISKLVEVGGEIAFGSPYLKAWWSWELIAAALAFSFLVGAFSGLAPAYQASKQQPVESLRYE